MFSHPGMRRVGSRQSGAGMIEVLIAIVIVAFALLGMAGLQASSLRYQKTAHARGLAVQYTTDIADRMRANMMGTANGNYVTPVTETFAGGAGADPGNCGSATALTAAQVAACDLFGWRSNLQRAMGGWGEISGSIATGYTVMVYFREPSKRSYDDTLDPACRQAALATGDTDIRCFSTVVIP